MDFQMQVRLWAKTYFSRTAYHVSLLDPISDLDGRALRLNVNIVHHHPPLEDRKADGVPVVEVVTVDPCHRLSLI